MEYIHGLNQYRIVYAKDYAKSLYEAVCKIEIMFQLSKKGYIDAILAENYIVNNIEEFDRNIEYFKGYITQREDMR